MLLRDRVTGMPLVPFDQSGISGLGTLDWQIDRPSGMGDIDWGEIISSSIKAGTEIAKSRFGGPQPGQYFQTGPNGQSVAYNIPPGSSPLTTFPGQSFGGNINFSNPLFLLGLGVLAIMVIKK